MLAGRVARLCCVGMFTAALLPSVAAAAVPKILTGPSIAGTPQVGVALTGSATWSSDPAPTLTWGWLRCAKPTGACDAISGATAASYRPVAADVGSVLRVRLRVTNRDGNDEARSNPTAVVIAAPTPTPTPTATPVPTVKPTPTPPPAPTPTPIATPVSTVKPAPTPVATPAPQPAPVPAVPVVVAALPPAAVPPALLRPFPVVRIKGSLTPTGARVKLLSVRAPGSARVTVTCRGPACPVRRYRAPSPTGRLHPFERELRAGTRLEVRVTQSGLIGKSTVIVIRRQAAPKRTDRCLPPGATRPVRCPVT